MSAQASSTAGNIAKIAFVFGTVAFCLVVAAMMGFDQNLKTKVSETVADGLISLAMFVAISYLAAQSVDTSGILSKVASRISPVAAMVPVSPPPQYAAVDPTLVDPEAKG